MTEKKTIKIFNTEIHEVADLRPTDFLEKVKNVRMIRTGDSSLFTFYPTDKKELERNRLTWEYVNGNLNAMNYEYRYYFCIEFPEWLYLFLKYSTWENVEKSIIVALTGLYTSDPRGRDFIGEQVENDTLIKVKELFRTNFKEFENFVFIQAEDMELMDEINSDYWEKEKLFVSKFDYFFRDNSGNPVILPYIYPVRDYRFKEHSLFTKQKFDVDCTNSYFTDSDWDNIINRDSADRLDRSESQEEPWKRWKNRFISKNKIGE